MLPPNLQPTHGDYAYQHAAEGRLTRIKPAPAALRHIARQPVGASGKPVLCSGLSRYLE